MIEKVAWILTSQRRVLSTRSRGKTCFYLPGGKPQAGESDLDTLVREIDEELGVEIERSTARLLGEFVAVADGSEELLRMRCYEAGHRGVPRPCSEIEEVVWLAFDGKARSSPVDNLVFDHLRALDRI